MDLWQEVEAKVSCDNDFPVVKTANKVGLGFPLFLMLYF